MGFEVFSRQTPRLGTVPALNINPNGRIGINQTASRLLGLNEGSHALLLWDKERSRLAIQKASEDDARAYTVSYANRSAGIHALTFLKYIGYAASKSRSLFAEWNQRDSLLEVQIPPELVAANQNQGLVNKSKGGSQKQKK